MRQWDTERGEEIQRCDLKCGKEYLAQLKKPYLSTPVRMRGPDWIHVIFERETDPEVIFSLFDNAVASEDRQGFTIVLGSSPVDGSLHQSAGSFHSDTALPFGGASCGDTAFHSDPSLPSGRTRPAGLL